jgi:hypothetical protein
MWGAFRAHRDLPGHPVGAPSNSVSRAVALAAVFLIALALALASNKSRSTFKLAPRIDGGLDAHWIYQSGKDSETVVLHRLPGP